MSRGHVYEQAAREMLDAAEQSRSLKSVLRRNCPWVVEQLRRTAELPEFLNLWGKSLNYDEHALAVIVDPAILNLIGELGGRRMRGRIQHAGLMHTYGYLFSRIETPFGRKHDRWINGVLDRGFGFKSPTLSDQPKTGTLLLNLTYFLSQIAFQDQAEILERIQVHPNAVAPAVEDYPYKQLSVRRMVEKSTIKQGRRKGTSIELHSNFVTLPNPPESGDAANTLLVYSVVNGSRLGPQLITAFTMNEKAVDQAFSPMNLGENVEIRTRYNAYVEGLTGRVVKGRRFVVA